MIDLSHEWSAANPVPYESVARGSGKKFEWVCSECSNVWSAVVGSRHKGAGCPSCSRKRSSTARRAYNHKNNPLSSTLFNELVNKELVVSAHSVEKVEWQCGDGHRWFATPHNRTNGTGCPECANRSRAAHSKSAGRPMDSSISLYVAETDVSRCSHEFVTVTCDNGHEFRARAYSLASGKWCPKCRSNTSKWEDEVASLFNNPVRSDRNLIYPFELDIYLPDNRIAIECNGLYWHSDKFKQRYYHQNKYELCKAQGIQLITLWEDQWQHNKSVVKRMLLDKVEGRKAAIGARSVVISDITIEDAATFLGTHHIQGGCRASRRLGAFYNGRLVGVCCLTEKNGSIYVDRFASSITVHGLLDRFLKHNGAGSYVTFADHCVSDGGMYIKGGWNLDAKVQADYKYVFNGRMMHKFNFRKSRFHSTTGEPMLDGETESQACARLGIYRVYDCGKSRFTKVIK